MRSLSSVGFPLSLVLVVTWSSSLRAGPPVDVIIASDAPQLERLAGEELASQLKQLFNADVKISHELPERSEHLILIGSPETNPLAKRVMREGWPKLSDQGLVIRSVQRGNRNLLVVGGGSPVATLWAVYELGHRFGVRYLLNGDVFPAQSPPLKLDGFDVVMEPTLRTRTWRTVNDFAIGPEAWGVEEHRQVLRQLAKLKFNRVMLSLYPWQPFVHFEFGGVKKSTGVLWYGWRYPISGDSAGRAAFGGAKEFYNPDLAGKDTYSDRTAAGIAMCRGIVDTAHDLGMSTAIAISPLEFPKEFAAALPGAKILHGLEDMTVGPGPKQLPDDPLIKDLAATQIRAYLDTYPKIDALYLTLPEFPDWVEHHEQAWKRLDTRTGVGKRTSLEQLTANARDRKLIASGDRGVRALRGNIAALDFLHTLLADPKLLQRPDGSKVEVNIVDVDSALYPIVDKVLPPGAGALHFVDYTARRVASHSEMLDAVPAKSVKSSLILTLADDNVGVLPQITTTSLHALVGKLRSLGWDGFSTRYWITGDLNPAVYYLSRSAYDATITPERAYSELITPMSGEGVAERLIKGLNLMEQATTIIDENDIGFTFPVPSIVMKHYAAGSPAPAWWKQVRDLYAGAMDEMYRCQDRSEDRGRPLLRYYAKRLEFAYEFLNSIESTRLAGVAKKEGDSVKQIEHLEKAVESMYNALNAYSEVARDSCDRGVIAVLNEYGYRPLQKELEAQSQ